MAITLTSARLLTLRHTGEPETESNSWYDSASAQPYAIIDNAINQAEQDIGQELMMRGCEDSLGVAIWNIAWPASTLTVTAATADPTGGLGNASKILMMMDQDASVSADDAPAFTLVPFAPLTRLDQFSSSHPGYPRRRLVGSGYSSTRAFSANGVITISPTFSSARTIGFYYVPGFGRMNGIASYTVTAAGTGYTSVPTVTITDAGGSGATATAVLSATTVASITVNNPGSNYGVDGATTVAITGGGGASATATAATGVDSVLPDEARYALAYRAATVLLAQNGRDDAQIRGLFTESMNQLINALQADRAGRFPRYRPRYQGIIP